MEEDFRRGDVIVARYELHEVVGSGAGGRIWLAFDRNLGGRETAIKFYEPDTLISDLATHVRKGTISRDIYEAELSNIYARFRQEAIRISRLDHPVIVKVFDYRDKEYEVESRGRRILRDRPFLAMEFIRGQTVEQRLAAEKLPLKDALDIGAQVADGLAYAHIQNLVHRDLKPSNIMLESTPIGLRVRIIDWGVAKVVATEAQVNMTRIISTAAAETDDIHTRGILLGTPKFIAPEHFGSAGASWSPASDVFALGMFLFRLVTGQPVRRESYVGECLTQGDRELLKRACAHVPELAKLVLSCLSETREQRLPADAVRDQLRRIHDRLTGSEATPGAPGTYPTPPTRVASPLLEEAVPTSALTSPSAAPRPQDSDPIDDFEPGVQRGPGWLGLVIALCVGVGGGMLIATFAGETPATGLGTSGEIAVASAPPSSPNPAIGAGTATALSRSADTTGADTPTTPNAESPVDNREAPVPAAPEVDPDRIELTLTLDALPPSKVSAKGPAGFEPLGNTPLSLTLKHRFEARVLRFEPAEESATFNPEERTIHAWEHIGPDAEKVIQVKLPCVNVFDPKCNDYSKKFDKAFEKEAGE